MLNSENFSILGNIQHEILITYYVLAKKYPDFFVTPRILVHAQNLNLIGIERAISQSVANFCPSEYLNDGNPKHEFFLTGFQNFTVREGHEPNHPWT